MKNRRQLIAALSASTLAMPLHSLAQQAKGKVWRIGFLGSESATSHPDRITPVRAGLRDFGYEEGKNIVIIERWAEGKSQRLPELAAELVQLQPDVIISHASLPLLALKQSSLTIPVVSALTGDAVLVGLVDSLAKPGGNITGTTFFSPELMAKRVDLLKGTLPRLQRMAVLLVPSPLNEHLIKAMSDVASKLKISLHPFVLEHAHELDGVFISMTKQRIDSLVVHDTPRLTANAKQISSLALKHRLLSIGSGVYASSGGLIGYGVDILRFYRRAGYFVDKILKGAKPTDIPMEQPTTFEMVLNLKTAKVLGIKVPQTILLQATKVIE